MEKKMESNFELIILGLTNLPIEEFQNENTKFFLKKHISR